MQEKMKQYYFLLLPRSKTTRSHFLMPRWALIPRVLIFRQATTGPAQAEIGVNYVSASYSTKGRFDPPQNV